MRATPGLVNEEVSWLRTADSHTSGRPAGGHGGRGGAIDRNSFNSVTWIFEGKMNVKWVVSRLQSINGMWLGWRARYVSVSSVSATVVVPGPWASSGDGGFVYLLAGWPGKALHRVVPHWRVFVALLCCRTTYCTSLPYKIVADDHHRGRRGLWDQGGHLSLGIRLKHNTWLRFLCRGENRVEQGT